MVVQACFGSRGRPLWTVPEVSRSMPQPFHLVETSLTLTLSGSMEHSQGTGLQWLNQFEDACLMVFLSFLISLQLLPNPTSWDPLPCKLASTKFLPRTLLLGKPSLRYEEMKRMPFYGPGDGNNSDSDALSLGEMKNSGHV